MGSVGPGRLENACVRQPLLDAVLPVVDDENDRIQSEPRLGRKTLGGHLKTAVAGKDHYPLIA